MPPAGDQHNFNTRRVSPPQSSQIVFGNLKLWIEQRAIDIGSQQADGPGLWSWARLWQGLAWGFNYGGSESSLDFTYSIVT